jgi:hypothetical protein
MTQTPFRRTAWCRFARNWWSRVLEEYIMHHVTWNNILRVNAWMNNIGPSFMSSFTSSFTTSIAKQPTLCLTLWSAYLKTHSHRVKHMVKLQKHGSLPCSWSCSWSCFLKNSSTGEAELCQTGPLLLTSFSFAFVSFAPLGHVGSGWLKLVWLILIF